jgi:hypothetical protein
MVGSSLGRRISIVISACAALALAACGGGSDTRAGATSGPERSFMMGISTLPRELNGKAYSETFDLAAANGEMVLIQRTPPWADFVPGADISEQAAKTTASEKDAITSKHLRLLFAIDPTDGSTGRDRLADLPTSMAGKDFSDPDVRSAFLTYAQYVAINYKPAYMALGVEMNLYSQKNKEDFENFKSLYFEAYDRVKESSPDTQVTVTFQYEDLQGKLPTEDKHFPAWQLVKTFDAKMDVAAISTYPSFVYARAGDIPDNYYSQLRGFTAKPIVIAEMGYASAAGVQGINSGSEEEQAAFLTRALAEAQGLSMPFVIWFAGWDPAYAKDTPFSVFQHIGLIRTDGSEKPAWALWAAAARRLYTPPPTVADGG